MTNKIRDIRDMILNNPDKKLNFKYNACVLAPEDDHIYWGEFQVQVCKDELRWFTWDYNRYVYIASTTKQFAIPLGSELGTSDRISHRLITDLCKSIWNEEDLLYLKGRVFTPLATCKHCGKRLISVKSILRGYGPECSGKN